MQQCKTYKEFQTKIKQLDYHNAAWGAYVSCRFENGVSVYNDGLSEITDLTEKGLGCLIFGGWNRPEYALGFEVNCNDYFIYACSDSEVAEAHEIFELSWLYDNFKLEGVNVWCSYKRARLPLDINLTDEFVEIYNRFPELMEEFEQNLDRNGDMLVPVLK